MRNDTQNIKDIGRRTARNSLYSMGVNGCYLLSRFLLTPVILHYLPLAEYGLWSLCFVVMSFLALSSMGLEATYIKYVAQYHAEKKPDAINSLLSTGLLITTILSCLLLSALWIGLPPILTLLNIPEGLTAKASFVIMTTGLIFMLDISLNCFARALDGFQYLALTAKIRFWSSLVELIIIIPLLMAGYGIYGLMGAFFIRYLLVILINIFYAYRLIPHLSIRFTFIDLPSLKTLACYGGKMQLLSILNMLTSTVDRLIITSALGLAANGLYEIGRKIPSKGARIPAEISGAIMPALSHLQGSQDMEGARTLFNRGTRYMAMLSAPLFTFFSVIAPYAIFVWLGPGYEAGAPVMTVVSLATVIHLFTGTSSALARGLNRLDWELKYSFLNLTLCFTITPLFASWFGLTGAAFGVSIGITIASGYFLVMTHRYFKIGIAEFSNNVLPALLISFAVGVILFVSLSSFAGDIEKRAVMFALLVLVATVYFPLIFLLMWLTNSFTSSEKRIMTNSFNRFFILFQALSRPFIEFLPRLSGIRKK